MQQNQNLTNLPLTRDCWDDIVSVFGGTGDGGCWCMWWRLSDREFSDGRGEANRNALRQLVCSKTPPGVIGYVNGQPAGWCSIGPREEFVRLEESDNLKRIDSRPVWSIVCYYVNPAFRGRGLMRRLTEGAVDLASSRGARIVEAYPIEAGGRSASHAYTGIASVLSSIGFEEAARASDGRPIMRFYFGR